MRRLAYICILVGVWLVGMAALLLGLDSILHPPFFPLAIFAGGYWAALCSVLLAEEASEWMGKSGSKSVQLLPRRCPGGQPQRIT
jgi:hypothetical protein